MSRRRWTAEDDQLMRELYPDHTAEFVAERLRRSVPAIHGRAAILNLTKSEAFLSSPASGRLQPGDQRGASGRFQKGHQPANKGAKGWKAGGRSAETQFKPGHRGGKAADLYQPIGTERITRDGYVQRKVNDDLPLQRRWKLVHRILWEEHHGPIPKGHVVVFKNGNKQDLRIENLELITQAENMRRNTIHNLPQELADVCRLKGRLVRQINKRERHEKQD